MQLELNKEADLTSLRNWACDYAMFIKELHFMNENEIPMQLFEVVQSLKGLIN